MLYLKIRHDSSLSACAGTQPTHSAVAQVPQRYHGDDLMLSPALPARPGPGEALRGSRYYCQLPSMAAPTSGALSSVLSILRYDGVDSCMPRAPRLLGEEAAWRLLVDLGGGRTRCEAAARAIGKRRVPEEESCWPLEEDLHAYGPVISSGGWLLQSRSGGNGLNGIVSGGCSQLWLLYGLRRHSQLSLLVAGDSNCPPTAAICQFGGMRLLMRGLPAVCCLAHRPHAERTVATGGRRSPNANGRDQVVGGGSPPRNGEVQSPKAPTARPWRLALGIWWRPVLSATCRSRSSG